jgi:hypothetical protein
MTAQLTDPALNFTAWFSSVDGPSAGSKHHLLLLKLLSTAASHCCCCHCLLLLLLLVLSNTAAAVHCCWHGLQPAAPAALAINVVQLIFITSCGLFHHDS